jgi:hypothetical protein
MNFKVGGYKNTTRLSLINTTSLLSLFKTISMTPNNEAQG